MEGADNRAGLWPHSPLRGEAELPGPQCCRSGGRGGGGGVILHVPKSGPEVAEGLRQIHRVSPVPEIADDSESC